MTTRAWFQLLLAFVVATWGCAGAAEPQTDPGAWCTRAVAPGGQTACFEAWEDCEVFGSAGRCVQSVCYQPGREPGGYVGRDPGWPAAPTCKEGEL